MPIPRLDQIGEFLETIQPRIEVGLQFAQVFAKGSHMRPAVFIGDINAAIK